MFRSKTSNLVGLCAVVAAAAGGCSQQDSGGGPGPDPTAGAIAVISDIAGAAIFLDGALTGLVTPDTLYYVSPGTHEVAVQRVGFTVIPPELPVNVSGGVTEASFALSAVPGVGSIAVASDTPGGEIVIDGLPTGRAAPDTIDTIPEGSHEVALDLLGFEVAPAPAVVGVTAGSTAGASFTATPIVASTRTVLLEHFTAWKCVPCLQSDPGFFEIEDTFDRDELVFVVYHDISYTDDDPYYLANKDESLARVAYYAITSNPTAYVDGGLFLPEHGWAPIAFVPEIKDTITTHHNISPDFTVTVRGIVQGGIYAVRAAVTAHADYSGGGIALRCAVIEREIIPSGPQPLGQTRYPWVMRDMVPDSDGETFAIGNGETIAFERESLIGADWNLDEIGAIVFVQRADASRAVLQTGHNLAH